MTEERAMRPPVRVALLGLGRAVFTEHLPILLGNRGLFRVVAACDVLRERQLRPAEEVEETVSRMWLDCLEMDDSFDLMEDIAPRYHLRHMENPGQLMDFLDRLKAFADAVPRVSLHGFRPSLLHPEIPIPVVGRNDPCPCGSGLKYKKCHGKPGI